MDRIVFEKAPRFKNSQGEIKCDVTAPTFCQLSTKELIVMSPDMLAFWERRIADGPKYCRECYHSAYLTDPDAFAWNSYDLRNNMKMWGLTCFEIWKRSTTISCITSLTKKSLGREGQSPRHFRRGPSTLSLCGKWLPTASRLGLSCSVGPCITMTMESGVEPAQPKLTFGGTGT